MLLMHCEQLKDSNSSVEIFFEGNPALLGNITLFNTKANWFNTYNEIRYVDRKYFFANSVLTLVGKHTLKVLAAVTHFSLLTHAKELSLMSFCGPTAGIVNKTKDQP